MLTDASFCYFRSVRREIGAPGMGASLPPGGIDTLDERVRRFFADPREGPGLLLGALPFERTAGDCLGQPLAGGFSLPASDALVSGGRWSVSARPGPAGYAGLVGRALEAIREAAATEAGVRKVVLARQLLAEAEGGIDASALLARLADDRSVTAFLVPLGAPDRALVGATPELLVAKQGAVVTSFPLAGSARRWSEAGADFEAGSQLEASEKNRREHRLVVEAIMDVLAPHCAALGAPEGTGLRATASMWHLGTRIEGRLKDSDMSVAALAALLHPTPAVCGTPREAARRLIAALEPEERGFYAGAVGWIDARGDGEWHVALRCGEISGSSIRLYAGAGIVAGSDPRAEADETSAKFRALLDALGIGEDGSAAREECA